MSPAVLVCLRGLSFNRYGLEGKQERRGGDNRWTETASGLDLTGGITVSFADIEYVDTAIKTGTDIKHTHASGGNL